MGASVSFFVFVLSSLLLAVSSAVVHAELRLPSATRAPDLGADPFERLRNATKKTEPNKAVEPAPAPPEVANTTPPLPIPSPVAPSSSANKSAFSHEFILDLDYVYKIEGGVQEIAAMDPSDTTNSEEPSAPPQSVIVGLAHYIGEFDPAAAGLWENGHFLAHIISGLGDSPTITTGDLRSVSNIDASFMDLDGNMIMPSLDLVELWYQHSFPHSKTSLRFGILSYGFEFYRTRYSGLFLHSAFGIGTEVLWDTMVSNPPTTSLGFRGKTELSPDSYLQIGLYDGLPDHSADFVAIDISEEEGFFLGAEVGFTEGKPKTDGYYKYAIGGWYLRQDMQNYPSMVSFENASEEFISGTGGWYVLAEKGFSDSLGVFFKTGQASEKINKYALYYSGGVWYKGLLDSRPSDVVGFGIAKNQLGSAYLDVAGTDQNGDQALYDAETIYEITYSIPVNDWLTVQPDIQYIDNPGFTVLNLDLWAAIIRLEAVF